MTFVTRERHRECPEVHVAGMCIAADEKIENLSAKLHIQMIEAARIVSEEDPGSVRILIARRSPDRELYPGLYEGCGGQLKPGESFALGVERHYRDEMGIAVRVDVDVHRFYEVRTPDGSTIPGIRFLCFQVGDDEPRSANHTEVRWVAQDELMAMDAELFIPGLRDDFLALLGAFYRE